MHQHIKDVRSFTWS